MTTIVTGATGSFGRLITAQLLEHLHPAELILTTRNPPALANLAARGAHVRYADFDRPETLAGAFEDGDRMLLISTLSVGRRATQHRNAIEAAVRAGVKHIVYTSSGGATPANPAIVIPDHLQTEDALKTSGVAYTISIRSRRPRRRKWSSARKANSSGATGHLIGMSVMCTTSRPPSKCRRARSSATAPS